MVPWPMLLDLRHRGRRREAAISLHSKARIRQDIVPFAATLAGRITYADMRLLDVLELEQNEQDPLHRGWKAPAG